MCESEKIREKRDFGHFRLLEQHADGCVRLAIYNFLLVFYSNLRQTSKSADADGPRDAAIRKITHIALHAD